MNVLSGLKLRVRITWQCARVILQERSLLLFPFVSMVFASAALGFFYFTVGPDKMQLMLNTLRNEQGVQTLNVSYYGALAVALFLIVALSTAMNFALVACVRARLAGNSSTIWDGLGLALKRFPAIVTWALLYMTLGTVWTILDQERRSSTFLRRKFGNTWHTMSLLTVPVAVCEKRNIFSALLRSRSLMQQTWGEDLTPRFGFKWFLLLACIPLVIKLILLEVSGTGITLPFAEFALVYFACTLIIAQAAKAVYKVALYSYAANGEIHRGFDKTTVQGAFWHQGEPITAPEEPEEEDDTPLLPLYTEKEVKHQTVPDAAAASANASE